LPSAIQVVDIRAALAERTFPSVTVFNRLEGRPRTLSFERALRAEVRDALWMLTKQWQMGEFRGSDAGSPVFAKVLIDTTRLTKYRPDDEATQPFEYDVPFEGKVERRPLPLRSGGRVASLDIRVAMGRYWLRLIAPVGSYGPAFVKAYPIAAPDPSQKSDADLCAQPEVWETFAALSGLAMDGGALYEYLIAGAGNHAYDGVAGIDPGDQSTIDAIDDCAARFLAWIERQFLLPPVSGDDAWVPPKLEYQFAASAPDQSGGERVYVAEEYYQGTLDWYSLDRDAETEALPPVGGSEVTGLPPDTPRTTIPVPVSFAGMPNTRWWSFEDRRTNFGDIDAATTDLAKLMFLEFALVYANDWFVIPQTLSAGVIASIGGLAVTDTFGERLWITAAGSGADSDWQRWSMFTINVQGDPGAPADTSLVLLPTVAKLQESDPTEDVLLIRDEVANMVWGIEKTVPLATGDTTPGIQAARQTLAFYEAQLAAALGGPPPPPPPAHAPIRYRVMSTVPENWIPFIPVHVDGSNRQIQLQRAALPRILEGDPNPPEKVQPRTRLLREGLDDTPAQPYFVFEEEVPRAGTRVLECFERTRWTDGRVYLWLRVRRQTGRGEGSSGLAFDELLDVPVAD
jgi:hypothetical protein